MFRKTYILFINVTIQWVCFAADTKEFVRIKGERMANNVVAENVARSAIECSSKCSQTSDCRAVNFNPSTRACQLCNTTPQTSGATLETNTAWNIYHVEASCEPPWVVFGTSCYWMEKTRDDWDYSYNFCGYLGAEQVEISSAQENAFVASAAAAGELESVWLSLNDKTVEERFEWISGAPVVFTIWGSNEGIHSRDEDCVILIVATGQWQDVDCRRRESIGCEKQIA